MSSDIEKKLEHSRAAYKFAINSLPDPRALESGPVDVNMFEFSKESQVSSMLIEFGWAFYCRYEACLEAFIREHSVKLSREYWLENWMEENDVGIPKEYVGGLESYRHVRNWLHHRDGQNEDGTEIHLLPEHMDQFYSLFIWIASAIAAKNGNKKVD